MYINNYVKSEVDDGDVDGDDNNNDNDDDCDNNMYLEIHPSNQLTWSSQCMGQIP